MLLLRALVALVALATLGCRSVPSSFQCARDSQCVLDGVAGRCEPDGACSLPDAGCPSGRRYVDAGDAGGGCVAMPMSWVADASGSVALLRGVWGTDGSDVYVVGDGGTILHSTGDGRWTAQLSPKAVRLDGIAGASATDIYISGNLNTLLHGNGTGQWTTVDMSTHAPFDILSSLFYATPSLVYAVGNYGFILHADGQGGWGQDASGTMGWLRQIWGSSASDLYTVGDAGLILHGAGDGTWSAQTSATSAVLFGVWGASAAEVYAVGEKATVLRSPGDGSWSAMAVDAGSDVTLWGVFGTPRDRFIVGDGGLILHGSDGATFAAEPSGTTAVLRRGWVSPQGRAYVVGDLGTILHRDL